MPTFPEPPAQAILFGAVYGERGQPVEKPANRAFHADAREPKAIWEVPGSAHVGGPRGQPRYERRVIAFFDDALVDNHRAPTKVRERWKASAASSGARAVLFGVPFLARNTLTGQSNEVRAPLARRPMTIDSSCRQNPSRTWCSSPTCVTAILIWYQRASFVGTIFLQATAARQGVAELYTPMSVVV